MKKPLLLLLLDAFNQDYLQFTPFLASLSRASLQPQIGYECALSSVFTGQMPAQHGHWSSFIYAPTKFPLKRLFRVYSRFPAIHKILLHCGDTFDAREQKPHPHPAAYEVETLFDIFRRKNLPFFYGSHPWWITNRGQKYSFYPYSDDLVSRKIKGKLGSFQFSLVHFYELDRIGHQGDVGKLKNFLQQLDKRVEKLILSWPGEFLVFSDHGMHPVTNLVDVGPIVRNEIHFLESTMVRLWNPAEETKARLQQLGSGRFLTEEEKRDYVPSQKYGTDFWCLKKGNLIYPNLWNRKPAKAMHGYFNEPPVILLSRHKLEKPLYQMADLFSLVRRWLV